MNTDEEYTLYIDNDDKGDWDKDSLLNVLFNSDGKVSLDYAREYLDSKYEDIIIEGEAYNIYELLESYDESFLWRIARKYVDEKYLRTYRDKYEPFIKNMKPQSKFTFIDGYNRMITIYRNYEYK